MTKITVLSVGTGTCSLSGKEGPGLTVSFDDGTLSSAFLTWKSFQQLLAMKAAQKKPEAQPVPQARPVAQPVPANGPAVRT